MELKIFEDTNAKGLAEFVAIKLGMDAASMDALVLDISKWIIDNITLRMPIDLTNQDLGSQIVVVKKGEDAATSINRFRERLKNDFGVSLTTKGLTVNSCSPSALTLRIVCLYLYVNVGHDRQMTTQRALLQGFNWCSPQ